MTKFGKFEHLKEEDKDDFSSLYDERKELHGIVSKNNFEFIRQVNKSTLKILGEEWTANIRQNKQYWEKHNKIRDMIGIGRNKAVIGIGAGPSFKKNQDVLCKYVIEDGMKPWEEREFITIAANHQFKPLLELGVIPDFVLLVDAAYTVKDQLIKDVPESAKHTQLITGCHVNPYILEQWDRQGRGIIFYTTPSDLIQNEAREQGLEGFAENRLELGGNCLNGAWMIGTAVLQSTVFMGVANDLSFELKDDIEEQRKAYYADGDYSSNAEVTGSGRDEGKSEKRWAGYRMERKKIITPDMKTRYNFELDVVGTSYTLWVYKTWLETMLMTQTQHPVYLHYFNCTEGGILGVMARSEDEDEMKKPENWYFFDEVCINHHTGRQVYMTAMLEDAINMFIKVRRSYRWQDCKDAMYADGPGQRMD